MVYQKIGSIYGNTMHFPRQELSKIDYNLIARYLAYQTDEDESAITQKIIKRINFFSEEFPFKLKRLEKIFSSKKVFAFGYDSNYRITFYIKPYLYYDEKYESIFNGKKYYLNDLQLENIDYITYMFFVIENILPSLKEKYNFSDQINIVIDFDGYNADTELIRFILHFFNSYYPLILGRIHIIQFEIDSLKRNLAFRNDLDILDFFRVISYKNRI